MATKASVTLSIYEIRLRKEYKKEEYYSVDDFCNGTDLLKFVHEVIANWEYSPNKDERHIVLDEEKQKMIMLVPGSLKLTGRTICSLIETGDYGIESKIKDINTGEVKYEKTKTDADVLPFFIMFYIPKGSTTAIMISQRFRQYGATSIVADTIKKKFKEKFPDSIMEIFALRSTTLSDQFMTGGKLKKISFKCFDPKMIGTDSIIHNMNPEDYTLEYNIVSKRGKSIPCSILNIFRTNIDKSREISKLIEIPYYDYDEVTFEMNMNGHSRTLRATDLESLGSFFDITDDIQMNSYGLPTYESIRTAAMSILSDILKL